MGLPNQKVTILKEARSNRISQGEQKGRLNTLKNLEPTFTNELNKLLVDWFVMADDYLFKQSEQAIFGAEQNRYFETLRALRSNKELIKDQFKHSMSAMAEGIAKKSSSGIDGLSLVEDQDLDKRVAIEATAARISTECNGQWPLLRQRLIFLTQADSAADSELPFSPKSLVETFYSLFEIDTIELKSRLLLLKLLEQNLFNNMPEVYQQANAHLIDQKVLPDLSPNQSTPEASSKRSAQGLHQLIRQNQTSQPPGPEVSPHGFVPLEQQYNWQGLSLTLGGAPITPVLQQLQGIESNLSLQAVPANPEQLKALLQSQIQQTQKMNLNPVDSDMVHLVGLLFDFILDDAKLANAMKKLMAKLQMPIIKVALIDRDFFEDSGHSARILLNDMAKSAVRWTPSEDLESDNLFQTMSQIVETLCTDFETDIKIFEDCHERLIAELSQVKRKEKIYEQKLATAEKAQHQQELKTKDSKQFIEELLADTEVPYRIKDLLATYWRPFMNRLLVKFGPDSVQWKNSGKIAKELIWSLQPGISSLQAKRFNQVVPSMFVGLRQGLEAMKFDATEMLDLFQYIDFQHGQTSVADDIDKIEEAELAPIKEKIIQFEEKVEAVSTQLELDKPDEKTQIKTLGLSEYAKHVESFDMGSWFELEDSQGQRNRCKLISILNPGNKYIFANFKGEKVAERSVMGLATALMNDKLTVVEESEITEDALSTIENNLKASNE